MKIIFRISVIIIAVTLFFPVESFSQTQTKDPGLNTFMIFELIFLAALIGSIFIALMRTYPEVPVLQAPESNGSVLLDLSVADFAPDTWLEKMINAAILVMTILAMIYLLIIIMMIL